MNSRFKTEKTFISFWRYVATNLQQVCLPFFGSLLPSATFLCNGSPRHFHGFLSGINGGVFLQPSVSSYFACYLHVDITPSGIKKHHFQRVAVLRKKVWIFQKKRQMNKNCRRIRIKLESRLYHSVTMSKSKISHGTFATAEHLSCCHPDSLGPHWPGGTPAPGGKNPTERLGSQIRW